MDYKENDEGSFGENDRSENNGDYRKQLIFDLKIEFLTNIRVFLTVFITPETTSNDFDVGSMNDDLMGYRGPRKPNPQNMGQVYNNDEEDDNEHVIVIKPKEQEAAPEETEEEKAQKAEQARQAHLNNWQVALQNENIHQNQENNHRILPRKVYLRSPVDFHL